MARKPATNENLPKVAKMTDAQLALCILINIDPGMPENLIKFLTACDEERRKRTLKRAKKNGKTPNTK